MTAARISPGLLLAAIQAVAAPKAAVATGVAVAASSLLPWLRRRSMHGRMETEHSRFIAAAETSQDGFCLLTAVRDGDGQITDFCANYLNRNMEAFTGAPRGDLQHKLLSKIFPQSTGTLFRHLCLVVETGDPVRAERQFPKSHLPVEWVRYQAVRLADGVALTCSDVSAAHINEERLERLAEFNDSIFQNAPFSIFATDPDGIISAMNSAAEKLSGYSREDLVGKASVTVLHDRRELETRARELSLPVAIATEGFQVLTANATEGKMVEREWTLIRRDGSRTPISLAMRAVTGTSGELSGFVGIAVDITERKAMMDYVTHMANHDQLTGLSGRAHLQERIVQAVERARRYGTKVAIFVLDLDQFKRINDSLGHWAGDQVLLETANRLRDAVRSSDTVARMGGDEFVVVMEDMVSVRDIENCAANLVTRFAPEMTIEGHQLHISASVGVSVYPDVHGDARQMLKWADAAMYSAKVNGRNQHQVFNKDMLQETADRLSMERALRGAISRNELRLHYQPQISLTTGAVVGMEALLRWQHPEHGLLSPARFMPLAEETGLMIPIGEWAFTEACCEGQQIREELGMDLTVAVNLSPRQFGQKNLLEVVQHSLQTSGLPAEALEIEITENTVMVNSEATVEMLQRLRALGVRIAIDDFGTGFCNFSYLIEYKVDRLKIDQRFVRLAATDANAAAVVRSIIAMSHGLNVKVVAEGIETEEEMRFLMRRHCDEAQGYLISRPVPASEFGSAVRQFRTHAGRLSRSA